MPPISRRSVPPDNVFFGGVASPPPNICPPCTASITLYTASAALQTYSASAMLLTYGASAMLLTYGASAAITAYTSTASVGTS